MVPVLLAVVVGWFLFEAREPRAQIDDAYISYQYARNFVEGRGLVFNPGEYVEGYSNTLWTLLVAAGVALGAEAARVGWLLGVVGGAATLIATYAHARAVVRREHAWQAVVAAGVVASATSFAVWVVQGLETALFAALVTATLTARVHGRMGTTTCLAIAATLTRQEGALLAAVVLGLDALAAWRRPAAWRWVAAYLLFAALFTTFRLAYYGYPLPNVYYAKVGGVPMLAGVGYLIGFLYDGAVWLIPAAVVGVVADRRLRPGATFVALYVAYVVAIGGDSFEQWRFFVPILPCLAVFAVRGVEHAATRTPYAAVPLAATLPTAIAWLVLGRPHPAVGLACVVVGAAWAAALGARGLVGPAAVTAVVALAIGVFPSVAQFSVPTKRAKTIERIFAANAASEVLGRRIATKLAQQEPPPRLIATGGVGRIGFYTRLPVLDILGLVDPVVARSNEAVRADTWVMPGHSRSNAAYVLGRAPDYLFIPKPDTFLRIPALVAIWEHPEFQSRYVWDADVEAYRRKTAGPGR